MKVRPFFLLLIGIVTVLLLLGGGVFYWIAAQNPLNILQGKAVDPNAAMFVPKQAPAMVSLLVNPDQLAEVRRVLAKPRERRQARTELIRLQESLLANTDLVYEQDVKPWLGNEVTLAITTPDVDHDRSNGSQPGYLLAIATQDPERSREFLELFWQKRAIAGDDLLFEQYQGVKLIYADIPPEEIPETQAKQGQGVNSLLLSSALINQPTLATAVVGNQFVLFANHPKVLRDAITNVQAPELNLDNAPAYNRALEVMSPSHIGLTFLNLPELNAWLEAESITPTSKGKRATKQDKSNAQKPTGNGPNTAADPALTESYQTMVIALDLNRQGLVAETALVPANLSDTRVTPPLSKPVEVLRYIPANSPFSASGTNLDRLWPQVSTQLKGNPTLSQLLVQPLEDLQARWKFNLAEDVLSWGQGEYALGLLPSSENGVKGRAKDQSLTGLGDWLFIAERSNPETAPPAIAKLDELAKQQGYTLGSLEINGQTVSAWTRFSSTGKRSGNTLEAEVQGVHTTVGNYEIFATSVPAMESALEAVNDPITNRDRFQQAIAALEQPNNGYLYLDWQTSHGILERQFPILKVVELAGKPLFTHLQSLTLSSYGSQAGVQRGGIFLKLD